MRKGLSEAGAGRHHLTDTLFRVIATQSITLTAQISNSSQLLNACAPMAQPFFPGSSSLERNFVRNGSMLIWGNFGISFFCLLSSILRNISICLSENGWTDDFLCKEWFQKSFIPQAKAHNMSGKPILLILDGHSSHETLSMIDLGLSHGIIIFCLPPHTKQKLQPLDVGVFGPFSRAWADQCDEIVEEQGHEMRREDFVKEYISPSLPTSITAGHVPYSFPAPPTSSEPFSGSDEEDTVSLSQDQSRQELDTESEDEDEVENDIEDANGQLPLPASAERASFVIHDPLGLLPALDSLLDSLPPPSYPGPSSQTAVEGPSHPTSKPCNSSPQRPFIARMHGSLCAIPGEPCLQTI
jgi:hypothetical protein